MILTRYKSIKLLAIFGLLFAFSSSILAQTPQNQLRGGELQSKDEHLYGKVEVRMYSQPVVGTTSTFFGGVMVGICAVHSGT